ncbi:class I SAM-dependent methyltransferase [Candidatus Uhrbacteria bacterium]|nr:class I SAM-dependent methyltransferase [Candidatus Uhrbacteria bacterium]
MSNFDKATHRNEFFFYRDKELEELIDPQTGKVRSELTEKINCRICASPLFDHLFVKNGFDFVRCGNCTFVYVNPQLKEKAILKYYNEDVPSHETFMKVVLSSEQQRTDIELYKTYYDKLKTKIPAGGKVLDIGCSIGLFLKAGKDLGYDTVGLELNEKTASYAEEMYGVKVERKLLEDCKFPDNSFDAVSMFGVIEHLPQPLAVMKEIVRILKPGGIFLGRCPNVESLAYMILHGTARTFTGRNHLNYFSGRTLERLFKTAGFNRCEIDTVYSGKDSIFNHLQFLDPFGDEENKYFPDKFREFLANKDNVAMLEQKMNELGIGLKLRFFAEK